MPGECDRHYNPELDRCIFVGCLCMKCDVMKQEDYPDKVKLSGRYGYCGYGRQYKNGWTNHSCYIIYCPGFKDWINKCTRR